MLKRVIEQKLSYDDDINAIYRSIKKASDYAIRDFEKIDNVLSSKLSKDKFCDRFLERTIEMIYEKLNCKICSLGFDKKEILKKEFKNSQILFYIDGIDNFIIGKNSIGFVFYVKRNLNKVFIFDILKHDAIFFIDNDIYRVSSFCNSKKIFTRKIYTEFIGLICMDNNIENICNYYNSLSKISNLNEKVIFNNNKYLAILDFILGKIKYLVIKKEDADSDSILNMFCDILSKDEYVFLREFVIFV